MHWSLKNLNKPLFLALFFFAAMTSAKTVIVSDIDDTLKISHVLDNIGKLANASRTKNRFEGMSALYHLLLSSIEDSKIYYLTNAPGWLMKHVHTKLLRNGNFPDGEVLFRKKESFYEHKVKALRQIVRNDQPDRMILLGDNGEHDIAFYSQIAEEFPQIEFVQFIRMVYSPSDYNVLSLEPDQMGFVTPVEVALVLRQNEILPHAVANSFIWEAGEEILQDPLDNNGANRPQFFPVWQNCNTFIWPSIKEDASLPILSQVYNRIDEICQN